MDHEHEFLVLLVGVVIWIFIQTARQHLRSRRGWIFLVAAFNTMLAGALLTILEDYALPHTLNLLEHICYAASSLLLVFWCCSPFLPREDRQIRGER